MSFLEVIGLLVLVIFAVKLAPFLLMFVPIVLILFLFGGIIGTVFFLVVVALLIAVLFGKAIRIIIH